MFQPYYITYLALMLAGFVAGLSQPRKLLKPVTVILGVTFLCEILSKIVAHKIDTNGPVYHISHPIQIMLWGAFFYLNLYGWVKKTVMPITALLLLFALLNVLFLQPPRVFPANLVKLQSVVLLFWSFGLFFELLDRPAKENLFKNSVFIICIAVMWFNLVSFAFFEVYNHYTGQRDIILPVYYIHLFSNYVYYSLLLWAMLLNSKPYHE